MKLRKPAPKARSILRSVDIPVPLSQLLILSYQNHPGFAPVPPVTVCCPSGWLGVVSRTLRVSASGARVEPCGARVSAQVNRMGSRQHGPVAVRPQCRTPRPGKTAKQNRRIPVLLHWISLPHRRGCRSAGGTYYNRALSWQAVPGGSRARRSLPDGGRE